MKGAGPSHPFRADPYPQEHLEDAEGILASLESAQILRLEGKRRDFRGLRDADRWADMRAEFHVANWHVRRGVRVEFGSPKTPNPDLIVPDFELGLEVTRRARNGLTDLRRAVRAGCRNWEGKPRPQPRILVTGQPLSIRSSILTQITEEVSNALRDGQDVVNVVMRPASGDRPAMTARITLSGGSVSVMMRYHPDASDLTVTMADIEQLALDCLDDHRKRAQGASMTALLLIDISRLPGSVWLRSPAQWSRRLSTLLTEDHTFAGVGFVAFPVADDPKAAIGLRALSEIEATRMKGWATRMNLPFEDD